MFTNVQLEELMELLLSLDMDTTKIYLGCDSVVKRSNGRSTVRYATVLLVHKNGKNGCKVFTSISTEPNYDKKKSRPSNRLMTEVRKVCELYLQVYPLICDMDIEIHLDISTDEKHGSNCVATQAAGFVLGTTGIQPKLKPESFCASHGADHYANRMS